MAASAPLVGTAASPWVGVLVALSPIHALASRAGAPDALLVVVLLLALWLLTAVERHERSLLAAALGLTVGGLLTSGVSSFVGAGALLPAHPASRPARRRAAGLALLIALATLAVATRVGLARSPLDYGEVPAWIPETSAEGVARCAWASFTRVAGLEYHLVVSHARYVLPLTLLLVALMARGARRLPVRTSMLLVAGALLPFALGAALSVLSGRVTPLQASRLLAALPFVGLLVSAGLASLQGTAAWAARVLVVGSTGAFLALALAR